MKPMANDFIDCGKRYLMSIPILFNRVDKTFGKEFAYIVNEIYNTSHNKKVRMLVNGK